MRKLVLASGSPRREQLLHQLGLDFTVDPSGYPEQAGPGLAPHDLARFLSLEKARAAAPRHPGAVVLAADTFGVFEDRIIGKPGDAKEAREILAMLCGRWHSVITGFTVLDTESSKCVTESVETLVFAPATRSDAGHPRQVNLVVLDAETGRPVQAVKIGC